MDYNYNKSTEKVYRALQKEYKRVLDEVNAELLKWENIRANNERPDTFGWSEEKNLKETKKAIEMLLDKLAENEYKLLSDALDTLYAQDLLDMNKLEIEYLKYRDDLELQYISEYMAKNPLNQATTNLVASYMPMAQSGAIMSAIANRTDTIMWIEQVLRQPIPVGMLSQNVWYRGCNGKGYAERIATRAVQLKTEINQAITSMYSGGKGYKYASERIAERLGVSNYYAQRLVQTECRVAEVQANRKHYDNLGVKYYKRSTVNDSKVCPLCKKLAKRVYT